VHSQQEGLFFSLGYTSPPPFECRGVLLPLTAHSFLGDGFKFVKNPPGRPPPCLRSAILEVPQVFSQVESVGRVDF